MESNERCTKELEPTIEEKIALRIKQWEMAMDGDVRMLIFLGKQYLGQKDNPPTPMNNPIKDVEFIDIDGNPFSDEQIEASKRPKERNQE